MPKPTAPITTSAAEEVIGPALEPGQFRYPVRGLTQSDHMPILFEGITYDLANLTPEQHAYLSQFPDQVPYLAD